MKQSPSLVFRMLVTVSCISPYLDTGLTFAVTSTTSLDHDQGCKESCNFKDRRIECTDCIPSNVTPAVREIVLSEFNESRFLPRMFCGVSWPKVVNLTIVNSAESFVDYFNFVNFTFDCLSTIKMLKLSFSLLSSLGVNAFDGLTNVKILDLTGCIRLEISGLTPGLLLEANVPKLQTIILSNLGSAYGGITISQEIIDILVNRNISSIDISSSTVRAANAPLNIDRLCESLEKLNLANSRLLYSDAKVAPLSTCNSLRVVNLSGVQFPGTPIPTGNITIPPGSYTFDPDWFPVISNVSVIYLNNIISPDHFIHLNNLTLYLPQKNSIMEIHLSGYSMPVFEVKFKVDSNHVKYFDLSSNKIERLSPESFDNLEHLQIIDLSNNRLAISKQFEGTFSNLVRNNSKLEVARLAHNGLTYLPSKVFELNTALTRLDMSENKFTQITFEISHLYNLVLLDLRGNSVVYLNVWSMQQIDMLYKNKQEKRNETGNKTFILDLRNNPFSCQCHSLDFIKWFVDSPVFDSRDLYHCEIDNQHVPMNTNAIKAAKYDCDKHKRKVRKLLLITLLPCASLGILVFISTVFFKWYKRKKVYRRLREQIDLIREDQLGYRFPVFLSYASEDSDFVESNILQPLEVS